MFPVYRHMDSYPHQSNQMPFTQHYHPSLDPIPPQMQVDPAKFSVPYESWPYGGSYGYPMPCHACCNHNSFPGYNSFRPPYSHQPPPSHFHCCGYHPAFPEAYPVHYVPPHYTMEQPRYEYDKNVPRNYRCCGFPNHKCNQEENNGVKIEEHEPDVQERGSGSLVPSQLNNYPYPILWIPPDYAKNKEHRKPMESEVMDQDKVPLNSRPPESFKSFGREPRVWNECFPYDMNSLGSLAHSGDGKRTLNQHAEENKSQFPFPIIWMPSYDKQEEAKQDPKDMNTVPKSTEEPPSSFKANTVKHPDSDDTTSKPRADKGNPGSEVGSGVMTETAYQKTIPVKQSEAYVENTEDIKRKRRDVPVKHIEDNATKKISESERRSSSPSKTSRLPPVCLRVDPLPRRKNGNGSSRSPSPPGLKGCSHEGDVTCKAFASSVSKEHTQQDLQARKNSKEVEPNKVRKAIEVVERRTAESKNGNLRNESQTQIPVNLANDSKKEISRDPTTGKTEKDSDACAIERDRGTTYEGGVTPEEAIEAKEATDRAKSTDDECKAEKKTLSGADAAIIIQSAYRGFEVRKWESIKKMKQLAKVREQVVEVRNQIQALQSSSDLHKDDRQRVVIGEMIMSLLLKLDTIQGLHPSFRDVRKSLATELVTLQEKLDSLVIKKSDEMNAMVSTACPAKDPCFDTHNEVCMQESQNQETERLAGNSSESSYNNNCEMIEPRHGTQHMTNAVLISPGKDTSKRLFADKEVHKGTEDETKTLVVASGAESNVAELAPIMDLKDEADNVELELSLQLPSVAGEETNSEVECGGTLVEDLCHDPSEEYESRVAEVNGAASMNGNTKVNELRELPQVAIAEELAFKSEKDKQNGIGENDAVHGEVESILSIDSTLPSESDDLTPISKHPEMNQLAELSVGVIEEAPAVSELEKHEQAETGNPTDVTSSEDEPLAVNKLEQQPPEAPKGGLFTDDRVKFESQKEEELRGDAAVELEVEQPLAKEVSYENELSIVSEPEEIHPVSALMKKERRDEGHKEKEGLGKVDVDDSQTSELADMHVTTRGKEVPIRENDEKEEEVQEVKVVSLEPEFVAGNNKTVDQQMTRTVEMEDPARTQLTPAGADEAEEQSELIRISPTSSGISIDESDIGMEGNKKLIEENEKLREMIEKLIEVGKEQLTVISNLTGRVKDLEKKLPRKKKLTKRFRAARSRSSCVKPSDNA